MKTILIATVFQFFRQRSGMFFVLMGILFGFLSGAEHHAFAVFFLTGQFGMFYLFVIWLFYTLFCIHFLLNLWKQPEYGFVYFTKLWTYQNRFRRFAVVGLGFLQPLLYYGIFLFSVAMQENLLSKAILIFPFYVFFTLLLVGSAEWRINNPRLFVNRKQGISNWQLPRPVSWVYWSLEWLFREKGVTLLLTKAGAMIVFVCTLIYYRTDSYDLRLPAIGLSLGYLLNAGLSYELYHWENAVWLWSRSLPTSLNTRFRRALGLHMLVILPETGIALRYQMLTLPELIQLFCLGFSVLILFHAYLYKRNGLQEDTMQTVLFGFVGLTLAVLYEIPILVLASAFLVFSYLMYRKWYFRTGESAS